MTGTILEYLQNYGDVPLEQMPFNDVDSLILCQLAYLKFDGMVPDVNDNLPSVTLKEISEHADFDKLFTDERYEKHNRALVQGLLSGCRFRDLRLNCYINIIEKEWETQFSAVTYVFEDGTLYVAFRGTDETIIGWKEDFNMAFLSPVPGQAYSVKYLNMVTGKLHSPLYVGGHSKGGNLAIYSAMNCAPEVQQRIRKIYCMDGPGFRPEVLESCDYSAIADKVVKILPHSSIVGMIFEQNTNYHVIESKSFGIGQHDPYCWKVQGSSFIPADDVRDGMKQMDGTINAWVLSLNELQLRTFVDTLYHVLTASETDNLIDLAADWKKSAAGILSAMKEVDEDTRKILEQILKAFIEIGGSRMMRELDSRASHVVEQSKNAMLGLSRKLTEKESDPRTE